MERCRWGVVDWFMLVVMFAIGALLYLLIFAPEREEGEDGG